MELFSIRIQRTFQLVSTVSIGVVEICTFMGNEDVLRNTMI